MFKNKSSLYRIYRPSTFSDVAGHINVVNILKTELKDNSFTHAFLFTGQRGTGKTSVARIFAKAVNCQNLNDGDSCEKCENCLACNQGKSPDIFEIDAASNNGVDEIRNIKANVSTLPILGKYKVYIIDEVHMLSKAAFNALLKTLEEPPVHALFILATTEYAKIPATIVSRCQTFNFKKIDKNSLEARLEFIAQNEGFSIDENTKEEIYFLSDGSLRDALNILEQLMIINDSQITIDSLKNIFYVATKNEKFNIIKNIISQNTIGLISYFENAENQGMDFDVLALSLIEIIKEIIEFKLTNNADYLKLLTTKEVKDLKCEINILFTIADNLSDAYAKTKGTNVNFNYILISLLKAIGPITEVTSSSDIEPKIEPKKEVKEEPKIQILDNEKTPEIEKDLPLNDEVKIDIIDDKTSTKEKPKEVIFEKVEEPKIESETFSLNQIIEEKVSKDSTHNNEEISNDKPIKTFEELLELYTTEILKVSNSTTKIKVQIDEIINMLQGALKDERGTIATKFESWFKYEDNGDLTNPTKAQEFIVFKNIKIIAVSVSEILMVCESTTIANAITNQLTNQNFRTNLFNILGNKYTIYAIDNSKWDLTKKEFVMKKQNNLLNGYAKTNPDQYYVQAIEKSISQNPEVKELLDSAASLFGDVEVKINE